MKEKQRVSDPPSGRSPGQQLSGSLTPELDHHQWSNRRTLLLTAPDIRRMSVKFKWIQAGSLRQCYGPAPVIQRGWTGSPGRLADRAVKGARK